MSFGGLCYETKEYFLIAVPDQIATTLMATIQEQHITDDNIIFSDCWKGYKTEKLWI